ncbi:PRC-barrel domain-containing protein [Methanocaldococcus villosus KIN24-T80]|uniref:PRC-barrel domain-containing protein n=1 Tax=Methanocaldococcus villosus KIN24-T80 TaxID=1069083 RepID=N6UUN0_9EURY|nr:PRC-barrel domain-containing protein [Methanocaldococcus villosus]ENN96044.1 PRC-barrel domain-containing protein [Methanocaldococcus villosus KIN24-T80]
MPIRVKDILDKHVYTTKAMYVGKVYDVMVDVENGVIKGLILSDISKGCLKDFVSDPTKKVVIPYGLITAIGNIILVKPPAENGYSFLKR